MRKRQAEKLHNEDEITVKKTGEVLTVLSVDVYNKMVLVHCDNGNVYHHKNIRTRPEGHKEKVQKALQALYDAAYQVNQITDEDDYEQFPDLLDESANVINEFKNLGIVEDGIVSL